MIMNKTSNGDAVVSVNTLTRRVVVSSLVGKPINYKGYGCQFLKCPYPNRLCMECPHKFSSNVFF